MDDFMKFMLLSGNLEKMQKDLEPIKNSNDSIDLYDKNIGYNHFVYESFERGNNAKHNDTPNSVIKLICPECKKQDVNINEPYCPDCGCPIDYIRNNQPQQNAKTHFVCPECQTSDISEDAEYCPVCGCPIDYIKNNQSQKITNTFLICPECSANVVNSAKYCNECGCPIDYIKENQPNNSKHFEQIEPEKIYPLKKLFDIYDSIIVFDTETTGFDHKNDRIIELSVIKLVCKNQNIIVEKQIDKLIDLPSGMSISSKITELTGITNWQLINEGLPSNEVFNAFVQMFANEKALLVAYNAQFDLCFLYHSFVREGLSHILDNVDMLDALTVFKDRRSYPHKLKDAISAYHLENKVKNTHQAIDDTLALVEVLKAMDRECNDLDKYINLFGYNPKYGIQGQSLHKVRYLPQPYNSYKKIYQ